MKNQSTLITGIAFLFFLHIIASVNAENKLDSILLVLDKAIENHSQYSTEKEYRLHYLKSFLARQNDPAKIYDLNLNIYQEYKSYLCDSAIHYLNSNIRLARTLQDETRVIESKILLSQLLGSSGMYMEGIDLLKTINRWRIPPQYLPGYYQCFNNIYSEASFYTQDNGSARRYRRLANLYSDSLFSIIGKEDSLYYVLSETQLRDSHRFDEAFRINDMRLQKATFGTPDYAMVTFHRSLLFRGKRDRKNEKYFLVLSSLSDIQSSIKDHASLWMLADLLYQDGDIERAYRYIRFSWGETVFYNARLRSMQSAGILSLIDKTYYSIVEQKNRQLQNYLLIISFLVSLLAIALFFIYRQMKKLSVARNNLEGANTQLVNLNGELKLMNECLTTINMDLSESNQIKEEYIGRFIKLCSLYIDKLDAYRRMVNKKITSGKTEELYRITRSQDALDSELKELYQNFDRAFLQLFPNFVDEFNNLLQYDERIQLKKGELLNTELRIFALIRLGINDSSQIAEFLRYSVNTIYNYRAKVKNKSRVSRDEFEEILMKIR